MMKTMNETRTEIAAGFDQALVAELTNLQQQAFPPQMQFVEAARYYAEGLQAAGSINVILRSADRAVTGYLLALPQSSVWAELRQWDPQLEPDPEGLYVDIVQTLPGQRQANGFVKLVAGVCAEAERRGRRRLSMHARAGNGVSRLTQKLLTESRCLRRIENWYDSGEPFDYIEATTRMRRGR
jgi:hypothetical protein